jgi:Asp-tRNA(Asn)/Glu-tRNA(Gln) amidotransferase A subunit family amidase
MDPCDLTAVAARKLIGSGKLSPVELLESCIARVEAINPYVNAIVATDYDRARRAALAAEKLVRSSPDELPPLHGLPIGVKDLTATAGLRTTWGSPIYHDHVPERDDGVIAGIRDAGGIVVAKTNTPEWGAGANTRNAVYGATGNPFDNTRSSAGSSGGSAVALATGMVPLCTGTDMGGSLRNPAAFNGVVGMRPSAGLIPDEKRVLGWSSLSTLGPMARTVEDTALLLSVMARHDSRDPLSPPRTTGRGIYPVRHIDLSRVKAAFTPDFGFAPTELHIREVFAEKTALFRQAFGAAADTSPDCAETDAIFETERALDFIANHRERVRTRPADVGANVRTNVEAGLKLTAQDIAEAGARRTALYRRWQAFFRDFDVIITPTITISPRPWTELYPSGIDGRPTRTYFNWLALAYAVTLTGHPAISIPVGLDRHGMPFGMQIVGPRGADAYVLGVAAALERLLDADPRTARPLPDLGKLRSSRPIAEMPGFLG